jgi:hypothetical protein
MGRECSASDDDMVPPPDTKFTSFRSVLEVNSVVKLAFTSERAAEWTFFALGQEGIVKSAETYKLALSQWRSIDRGLLIDVYIQRKFEQPLMRNQNRWP